MEIVSTFPVIIDFPFFRCLSKHVFLIDWDEFWLTISQDWPCVCFTYVHESDLVHLTWYFLSSKTGQRSAIANIISQA